MQPRHSASAAALCAVAALTLAQAPASAGPVRDAVADLTQSLDELSVAGAYFSSDRTSSILSGLASFNGGIDANIAAASRPARLYGKVYDRYIAATRPADRRALLREIRTNVATTTARSGARAVLRDVFYIDFVAGFENTVSGGRRALRERLGQLFGETRADGLIERYELAVSRSR